MALTFSLLHFPTLHLPPGVFLHFADPYVLCVRLGWARTGVASCRSDCGASTLSLASGGATWAAAYDGRKYRSFARKSRLPAPYLDVHVQVGKISTFGRAVLAQEQAHAEFRAAA